MKWQPIETAPKDGRYMLLRFPGPFHDKDHHGITVGAWIEPNWWLTCIWASSSSPQEPTHWMPLPEPPDDS